jgi:predicted nucleotidyltransferase
VTAFRAWAQLAFRQNPNLLRAGYIGSYTRGDWGVGSDLDVVLVLRESADPFLARSAQFDLTTLPVPVDLLVYTLEEWKRLTSQASRFGRELSAAKWVLNRQSGIPDSVR